MVVIFTQKADDNLAGLVKAVDEVQKNNEKLGTFVVGVSGVEEADFEKLQATHKLTTPLTPTTKDPSLALFFCTSSTALTRLAKLSSAFWVKITTTAGRPSPPYFQT